MALLIPDKAEQFTTEGERQFYRFLERAAKPDTRFIAWYTPDIEGQEPDFLLYGPDIGLVVFEVKDWSLDQIRMADPHTFTLDINGRNESRKNPMLQARQYLYNVMDRIQKDARLVSTEPRHAGKPKIPMQYGVVFPNIFKYAYLDKGLDRVIECDKVFFLDDLHPESDICRDKSGTCFQKTLLERFPRKFSFQLSGKELDHLKQLLFPTVRIELPERSNGDGYKQRINRLKGLDYRQEVLARKFDGGHRIIVGPSGSGKTLVLVHKAAFLLKYNPAVKSILLVCFNIALVNYIRRLLSARQVPMGENGVQVMHFFELCARLLEQEIHYEKEDADYYELVVQEALERAVDSQQRYNAILVDEGQDFSDDMLRVLVSLLNPDTNNLTICLDERQNIYRRKASWQQIGVQARGRTHRLNHIYRNTREIAAFADRFIAPQDTAERTACEKQTELFPEFCDFSGPLPDIRPFAGIGEMLDFVGTRIADIRAADGCPCSEIAVLYAMQQLKGCCNDLPAAIRNALETRGILSHCVSQNPASKAAYDITTNSVAVSTIHSVKGLDYAAVFILGLDFLQPKGWSAEQIERLAYVAITRARYHLFIPYLKKTDLLEKLIRAQRS